MQLDSTSHDPFLTSLWSTNILNIKDLSSVSFYGIEVQDHNAMLGVQWSSAVYCKYSPGPAHSSPCLSWSSPL